MSDEVTATLQCPHCSCTLAVALAGAETDRRTVQDGLHPVYAKEFAELLGIGLSRFYELANRGLLPPRLPLPRRCWARTVVRAYLQSKGLRLPSGSIRKKGRR